MLLVGLAVGVDYSLFYLKREREERAAGRSPEAALEVAAATSGRAVLISGFTVIIAMAGMFLSGDKTFMSFAVGTMLVVAVAMLGSLTVLPATPVGARRQGREGPHPVPRPHPPRRRASGLEGRAPAGARASGVGRRRVRRAAHRAGAAGIQPPHLDQRHRRLPEERPRGEGARRLPAPVPGRPAAGDRRREGEERGRTGCPARDRAAARQGERLAADAQRTGARGQRRPHRGRDRDRAQRRRHRHHVDLRAQHAAERRDPVDDRRRLRHRGGRHGPDRGDRRLQQPDEVACTARVRVRARVRVPAPAGLVPLDRDRGQGDPAQPAVRGRRLRPARDRVPVGLGREPAQLQVERRDHAVAARSSCS